MIRVSEDGGSEYFKRNCTPEKCDLFVFGCLPNLKLWLWFEKLLVRKQVGINIDFVTRLFSEPMIAAFAEFVHTRTPGA